MAPRHPKPPKRPSRPAKDDPKMTPRSPQRLPKTAQEPSKTAQDCPNTTPGCPRWHQDRPKTHPRGPNRGPRGIQNRSTNRSENRFEIESDPGQPKWLKHYACNGFRAVGDITGLIGNQIRQPQKHYQYLQHLISSYLSLYLPVYK